MNSALNASQESPKISPMMAQYLDYKKQYPDALLLYQVGDFYEAFHQDAVTISRVLNVTLTSRDKNSPQPTPMAGVPIAVVDAYVDRLVNQGHSVAIVSQTEVPLKGMATRKLERIVTPGVRILGNGEVPVQETVVATVFADSDEDVALAFSEIQSGTISVREGFAWSALGAELARISIAELVVPRGWERKVPSLQHLLGGCSIKYRPESYWAPQAAEMRSLADARGYGALGSAAKRAVRLLVNYVDETTVQTGVVFTRVQPKSYDQVLVMDANTRANLDLIRNSRDGSSHATLFHFLNATSSLAGARLLRGWICAPLVNVEQITARQEAVRELLHRSPVRESLSSALQRVCDLERVAMRLELGVVSPRELGALRNAIEVLPAVCEQLEPLRAHSAVLATVAKQLLFPEEAARMLTQALVDDPPISVNEGGVIRDGFNEELDQIRVLQRDGRTWILELENLERTNTGINSLKIRYNNVIGFFFEVTKANLAKVPDYFIRRQSTVNSDRFTTEELRKREEQVLNAEGRQVALERNLFETVRRELKPITPMLRRLAAVLAELDCLVALATVAEREALVAPHLDASRNLTIVKGKHPVISQMLQGRFVPNSLAMQEQGQYAFIVSGPNMGGKSTYLRQAALMVILAQIGSFVPAERAQIGVVDRIFARLGASDNLAEGESTFMVEMREASHIVASATARSLILIDELGRGTATADGLAIATSVLTWLVKRVECRLLFATHFYELTHLPSHYPAVGNLAVGSGDRDGEVYFTHEITQGAANRSYGIEVARLAGLPQPLIDQARRLLESWEEAQNREEGSYTQTQMSLWNQPQFAIPEPPTPVEPADYAPLKEIQRRLQSCNSNEMTPLDALIFLDQLKRSCR